MSGLLHNLTRRAAGAAEPGMIKPAFDPWVRTDADRGDLSWDAETSFVYPDSTREPVLPRPGWSVIQHESSETREPGSPVQADNPVRPSLQQPEFDKSGQQVNPPGSSTQKAVLDNKSSGQQKRTQAELFIRKPEGQHNKDNPVSRIKPEKIHPPESADYRSTEISEIFHLKNLIERVEQTRVETEHVVNERHIDHETAALRSIPAEQTDLKRIQPPMIIQPVKTEPGHFAVPQKSRPDPEVIIENITIEVVREKRSQPVKTIQRQVASRGAEQNQNRQDRQPAGTKLRFGLGQM